MTLRLCGLLVWGHVLASGRGFDFVWTAPCIILGAFLIAWGAEAAQFLVSQGLALAILAWLQTLPEFAVEADIAWGAARGTNSAHEMTANFTGSIRLLVGFGMPVVYLISTRFWDRARRSFRPIVLEPMQSVEVISILPPLIYFLYILHKSSINLTDSIILLSLYVIYLGVLFKLPPEKGEKVDELPAIPRWVMSRNRGGQYLGIAALFAAGGGVLFLTVHPFVESLRQLAPLVGISAYFFIQWIAPFLSEFPEKLSAFNWARQEGKASMGLMNFLSSNINQWTLLVAMLPVVFSLSASLHRSDFELRTIHLDGAQWAEVHLTVAQSVLAFLLLLNMRFGLYDALVLFSLFVTQFFVPSLREEIAFAYLGFGFLELILFLGGKRKWDFPMMGRRGETTLRKLREEAD